MNTHLVSYATPRFRLRQLLLGWSARLNHVAASVTSWNPEKLRAAGFESRVNDIRLDDRGSGFWAWKPFIISKRLREVPDGDIVFYCDVGRLYPFKLLDQPISPYVRWMDDHGQDVMPGVEIPWDGQASVWTKRDAFVSLGMDSPEVHAASPVQASFSVWRASPRSRELAEEWMDLCSQRSLISDDPSRGDLKELPEFRAHRHDQALLTLLCLRHGTVGLDAGPEKPTIDLRHPSRVSQQVFGNANASATLLGTLLGIAVSPLWRVERRMRQMISFGKPINE